VIVGEVLWSWSIHSTDDDVISFVWLKGDSFYWSEFLFFESLDLRSINNFRSFGGVNTRCLDGNDEVTSVFDEVSRVQTENTGLIWLGDISENNVHHWHEHPVFLWMSGVLNDWDDVGSLFSHVN